jgi:tetratricopeptide (TPR) repeat protein
LQTNYEANFHGLVVEFSDIRTRTVISHIEVSSDGEFSAARVPFGDYMVRVTTYHGDPVTQQIVTINNSVTPIDIRMPDRKPVPSGRTVSMRELQNPPARQAIDASMAAQRFAASGNYDKAAGELEKALRVSPDFAVAHSSLGVQYLRLGRHDAAAGEIRRAIEIGGPNPRDLSNLAFALLATEHFPEAAANARAALKLQKDFPAAHYVLGLALVLEPETRGEGIAHLEEAAPRLESARRALAALGQKRFSEPSRRVCHN